MTYIPRRIIDEIKKDIRSGNISGTYGDYVLMTKLWNCTPSEFENQTEYNILLHKSIFSLESKEKNVEEKRQSLKAKALQHG